MHFSITVIKRVIKEYYPCHALRVQHTLYGSCKLNKIYMYNISQLIIPKSRSLEENIVTRSLADPPPPSPSTFDTIHPIGMKLGTYNKLHLYFQLNETTWYLIGLYGNNSQINDVTGGRHPGF